jgi:hypothetical protein
MNRVSIFVLVITFFMCGIMYFSNYKIGEIIEFGLFGAFWFLLYAVFYNRKT